VLTAGATAPSPESEVSSTQGLYRVREKVYNFAYLFVVFARLCSLNSSI
jgi:hypothetical protein